MAEPSDPPPYEPAAPGLPLVDRDGVPLDFPRRRRDPRTASPGDVEFIEDERSAAVPAVLAAVQTVPPGSAVSYGDVAEMAGVSSARLVGRVLARFGSEVPWHRVVMADGSPARHLVGEQLARLREENVALTPDGARVDLRRARPTDLKMS